MVAMSAATAPPDVPGPEQIDRRAHLLSLRDPDSLEREELDRLTGSLGPMMGSDDLRVRRVLSTDPPGLLERLVAREPVHPFAGPEDVADRLDDDRRCFVLEHPALPGRPFNVVWCALWTGICGDLAAILDPRAPTRDPATADAAVFYSIWNVEPGLVGLPGGARLIGAAVEALAEELPGLTTFVTLSPIPGLRSWLEADHDLDPDDRSGLLAAAARYLTSLRDDGRPVDPVARFHLGNGARLVAINTGADHSERGMARSYGLMANYRYEPEDRPANRSDLAAGRVAVGDAVAGLLH